VAKATAPISVQIWDGAGGQVAELTTAQSPSFEVTTGYIADVGFAATGTLINSAVNFTVTFTFQHQAVSSPGNSFPALFELTLSDQDFAVSPTATLVSTTLPGSAARLVSVSGNKLAVRVSDPKI